ncbi:hypothetical protein DFP73DRAFT_112157 [Morchella snyderi]|nr:hypothetical protein DFP73DRAFT_112157 [Morchella snyderi]
MGGNMEWGAWDVVLALFFFFCFYIHISFFSLSLSLKKIKSVGIKLSATVARLLSKEFVPRCGIGGVQGAGGRILVWPCAAMHHGGRGREGGERERETQLDRQPYLHRHCAEWQPDTDTDTDDTGQTRLLGCQLILTPSAHPTMASSPPPTTHNPQPTTHNLQPILPHLPHLHHRTADFGVHSSKTEL